MRKACYLLIGIVAAPAGAQTGVVEAADDAFGRRIGVESIGLYSEAQVRGFNLQQAGNYRIEGSYFVRSAAPIGPLLGGVVTRIGINALRYDFPSPSGVIEYELRTPAAGTSLQVEAGVRPGSGPFAEAIFGSAAKDGELGVVAAVNLSPDQSYADGSTGDYHSAGAVVRWSPSPGVRLTGLASVSSWDFGGDVYYSTAGRFLPPRAPVNRYRGQDWTRASMDTQVVGARADVELGGGWSIDASLFRAGSERERNDFNLLTVTDRSGRYDLTAIRVPDESGRSWSSDILVARAWETGKLRHRVVATARFRDSLNLSAEGVAAPIGSGSLFDPPLRRPEPDVTLDDRRIRDSVRQYTAGAGYRIGFGDALELRADVQRTRYRKSSADITGAARERVSTPWLFSGSLLAALSPRLTAFASYSRGLEESGTAPANAVNRGEVLPAVRASQRELGLRYQIAPRLSLIAGLFDTRKPVPGLDSGGRYTFVGDVRHRGVEASLAGQLTDRLSVVAGLMLLDARLAGDNVDSGRIGAEPVGRPERVALLSFGWKVPGSADLALDGSVAYEGERFADPANSFTSPGFATVDLGLRFGFKLADVPLTLRARITNVLDKFAWSAQPSGIFFFTPPRAYGLSLRAAL
jgi:iron complex outermembrane receptor protein